MKLKLFIIALGAACFLACSNNGKSKPDREDPKAEFTFTAERAPEYDQWFHRTKGWFGGDGIFMVRKDGVEYDNAVNRSEIIIWFSDTIIGEIVDGVLSFFKMINNSLASVPTNGNPPSFKWDSIQNQPASVIVPTTPKTSEGEYYWLGDGFINTEDNNNLYVIGYRIKTNDQQQTFGFEEKGNTLIIVPNTDLYNWRAAQQFDIPFHGDRPITSVTNFGAGIFVNTEKAGVANPDGYVYIYGVKGQEKELMVARVRTKDFADFSAWRFWDGQQWSNQFDAAKAIASNVSNELSVCQLSNGQYALVYQYQTMSPIIAMKIADRPEGPFSDMIELYNVSNDIEKDKDIFPYNAKVHTVLSGQNELVISYNVNSFDFFNDIKEFPNLYRPRFIRVKYAFK